MSVGQVMHVFVFPLPISSSDLHVTTFTYNVCRFQKHNLILVGLWYGDVKPTMTTFLAPLVKEMNHLSSHG